jgi:ABC-type bacteriocin/lantibiotic exporter with double-glycine peptidase domain
MSASSHGAVPPLPDPGPHGPALLRLAIRGIPMRQRVGALGTGIAAALLVSVFPVGAVWLSSALDSGHSIVPGLLLVSATLAGAAMLLGVRDRITTAAGNQIQSVLEPAVWDRLLRPDLAVHRRLSPTDLVGIGGTGGYVRGVLVPTVRDVVWTGTMAASALVILLGVSGWPGVVDLVLVVAVIGVLCRLSWRRRPHDRQAREEGDTASTLLHSALAGINEIQAYGRESAIVDRWAEVFNRRQRAGTSGAAVEGRCAAALAALPWLLLTVLSLAVTSGDLAGARLLVAAAATVQLAAALGRADHIIRALLVVGMEIVARLRDVPPGREAAVRALPSETFRGSLDLSGVGFRHDDAAAPALSDITLRIAPGEFIAVVGASGAGKSTLLRLIAGLARPSQGEIRYDGTPRAELDLDTLRAHIAFVPQDTIPPVGNVRSLITGSDDKDQDDRAWSAAAAARIVVAIRQLPMGLDTVVSDGDGGFSAGQIRQLMIARALATHPRVLLLDDPSRAMDDTSAERILQHISELPATRIIATHRVHTIRAADRVVVLDGGRIVECGHYRELIARNGTLPRLLTAHS